jgi:hypothetical protein
MSDSLGKTGAGTDIRIESHQRRVAKFLRVRVVTIELMCPSTDDYDLIKPRFQYSQKPPELEPMLKIKELK